MGKNKLIDFSLKSDKLLTQELKTKGIKSWVKFLDFVRDLPYGRTSNRTNLITVLKENKGTCSSKHALIKSVADENEIPNVKLILCMYKMTPKNTNGIGDEIVEKKLSYIPEAHCYVKISNENYDFTNQASDLERLKDDILEEVEIAPHQVGEFKVVFHKDYIKRWLREQRLNQEFEEIWKIRERCIQNLSNVNSYSR